MLHVAVVDDRNEDIERLEGYLLRYGTDHEEEIKVSAYRDPVEFTSKYRPVYDMAFLDIEMPYINGFEVAQKIRETDPKVVLVFVTGFAQYAPKGYEVNASGYLVKPVSYVSFYTLLDKLLRVSRRDKEQELLVHTRDGVRVLPYSEIRYIEIYGHALRYVTESGVVEATGSFTTLESTLPADSFVRPSNSYLVHLKYVRGVSGNAVFVGDEEIPISRARKKNFMTLLMRYFGDRL